MQFLKDHGPAIAKITFLLATAAETTYAGAKFAMGGGLGIAVALMIWGAGFILECCFAYSWVMKGSDKLAGKQVDVLDKVHNVSSLVMLGGLAIMLISYQVSAVSMLFTAWTSIVMPFAAVYLMHLLWCLKGLAPGCPGKPGSTQPEGANEGRVDKETRRRIRNCTWSVTIN